MAAAGSGWRALCVHLGRAPVHPPFSFGLLPQATSRLPPRPPCEQLWGLRNFASEPPPRVEQEEALREKLVKALQADEVVVQDTSGGCGTMYSIFVRAAAFRGKSVVAQHRMVNEALKDDVARWHGLSVRTAVP